MEIIKHQPKRNVVSIEYNHVGNALSIALGLL